MATARVARRPVAVPSPSCPLLFAPQQKARPAGVSAQVCPAPALTAVATTLSETRTGVPLQGQVRPWSLQRATAAAPSWSSAFDPQQRMACACVTPHVWALPAVNVLKRFPPDTGA